MKLAANDIELIEKSIEGSLSSDEAVAYKEKFHTSAAFRESVHFQRSLLSSLEATHKSKLKGDLTKMLHEVNSSKDKPAPAGTSNGWYLIAASVVILVGAAWIFNLTNKGNQKLFDTYYQPFPTQGFVRGDLTKAETDEILKLYADAKYQQTITSILTLAESGKSTDDQMLFLGNSYLALSQSEKAISAFQAIGEDNRYYQDSRWYLALAFLVNGDTEESMQLLTVLSSESSVYTTSARSLLEDLK